MGRVKLAARGLLLGRWADVFYMCACAVFAALLTGNLPLLIERGVSVLSVSHSGRALLLYAGVGLCLLAGFYVLSALKMGREYRFYCIAQKKTPDKASVFGFMWGKKALRAMTVRLLSLALHCTTTLLMLSPGVALLFGAWYVAQKNMYTVATVVSMVAGGVLLVLMGLMFALCLNGSEYLVYYILFEKPDITPAQAFRMSREITDGSLVQLMKFKLSFLPWFLLCVFVFPFFFVWGYYKQSLALVGYNNRERFE